MTRREWLLTAVDALRQTSVAPGANGIIHEDSPRLCAELLLCAALKVDKLALVRDPDKELTASEQAQASALLARRIQAEPMAYILGQREFYGRDFAVTPATLIPRPETECLVDTALQELSAQGVFFADLGSGTGCISVTLAAERPQWRGVALDISEDALAVARLNAATHGVGGRLAFVHGDMRDGCGALRASMAELCGPSGDLSGNSSGDSAGEFSGQFDLVVSNPPYISEAEYVGLAPDVRIFEPKLALVTGQDGLELPTAAVQAAQVLLRPGGLFLMEHGAGQGATTRALCESAAWERVATATDLAGLDRYLIAYRR